MFKKTTLAQIIGAILLITPLLTNAVCIGYNYEQGIPIADVTLPTISLSNNGDVQLESEGTTTLSATTTVDNGGSATIYWCTKQGSLVTSSDDFSTVQYIAPAGLVEDTWVHIFAQVSDGLGYVNGESLYVKVLTSTAYRVWGNILDDLGNPVIGATIQVGDKIATTDSTGYWIIDGLSEGQYNLTVSQAGFVFEPQDFEVGNQQLLTELKIEPLSELRARIIPSVWGKKAEQGKNFTYIITTLNGGSNTATGVSLEYQLPIGTELVEIQNMGNGSCEPVTDDNSVNCILPDLSTGATTEIEIRLKVIGSADLTNVATLTSNEYPVDVAKRWTKVKPYVSAFGKAIPKPVTIGGTLHYGYDIELNDNAPTDMATGIVLKIKLPTGLRLENAPGNCDTSTLPMLICQIDDLSIADPGDISHVTVNFDVVLEELGLIKLIAKSELSADGYDTHIYKTRAEIDTRGIEVDGVVTMDVTNSMNDQLNGVIKEVKKRITEGFANGDTPFVAIVTFRDEDDIKLVAATRNLATLLEAVESLEARDGGLCPEASADALVLALNHLKQQGTLIFITDAPPYDDAETQATLETVKELLDSKDINFVPIISEVDCGEGSSNIVE